MAAGLRGLHYDFNGPFNVILSDDCMYLLMELDSRGDLQQINMRHYNSFQLNWSIRRTVKLMLDCEECVSVELFVISIVKIRRQ